MGDLICRKSMMRCLTPGMCSPHGGCQASILEDCDVRYAGDSGSTAVNPFGPLAGTISAERDQLRAELERARADAERYRWLRDTGDNGWFFEWLFEHMPTDEMIDQKVDAAMGKGGGQNGSKTAETRAGAGLEGGAEGGKGGRADG